MKLRRKVALAVGIAGVLAACDSAAPRTPGDAGADLPGVDAAALPTGTPEIPPRGAAAVEAWLTGQHFLAPSWRCEDRISPPRLSGSHGRHRICSNELLRNSAVGPYPVGAASVKELVGGDDRVIGYAVGVKVEPLEGANTWYWYERRGPVGTAPLAAGTGVPDCAVCHGMAARDYVFFRAP